MMRVAAMVADDARFADAYASPALPLMLPIRHVIITLRHACH